MQHIFDYKIGTKIIMICIASLCIYGTFLYKKVSAMATDIYTVQYSQSTL